MKPEQFIRDFGVEKARAVIQTQSNHKDYAFKQYGKATQTVDYADLKRLVKSVDLVNSLGGIRAARSEAHKDCFVYNQPLLAAIAAYESIYGGGDD